MDKYISKYYFKEITETDYINSKKLNHEMNIYAQFQHILCDLMDKNYLDSLHPEKNFLFFDTDKIVTNDIL